MFPFERDAYVILLRERLAEEEREARERANKR